MNPADRIAPWAERIATSQRVTDHVYLNGDPLPTRNQIAAVIRSLADFTHNQHMLSYGVAAMGDRDSQFGAMWAHATGLGRYFHALADHIETGWSAEKTDITPSAGAVTPTPKQWDEQMDAERARQIEHGYDDAHDAEHGVAHLLTWAIDYARRGNNLAAATMARCALRMPRGTVTDTERPYSEAVDVEHGAWETDDIEERAHDLLAVVAHRRAEAAREVHP